MSTQTPPTTPDRLTDLATEAARQIKMEPTTETIDDAWNKGLLIESARLTQLVTTKDEIWEMMMDLLSLCNIMRPERRTFVLKQRDLELSKLLLHRVGVTAHAIAVLLRRVGGIGPGSTWRINPAMSTHDFSFSKHKGKIPAFRKMIDVMRKDLLRQSVPCSTFQMSRMIQGHTVDYSHPADGKDYLYGVAAAYQQQHCDTDEENIGRLRVQLGLPATVIKIRHLGMTDGALGHGPTRSDVAVTLAMKLLERSIDEDRGVCWAIE